MTWEVGNRGSALRHHIDRDHKQGSAAYEGTDETIAWWHGWEHKPNGYGTHLDHAHDEVSARRYAVPITRAASHDDRQDG